MNLCLVVVVVVVVVVLVVAACCDFSSSQYLKNLEAPKGTPKTSYTQNIIHARRHLLQQKLQSIKPTNTKHQNKTTKKRPHPSTAIHKTFATLIYDLYMYFQGLNCVVQKKTLSSFSDFFVFSHELLFCKN